MTLKKPRLNNLQLSYHRNDPTYEAVLTDLYLMGLIPKNVCEAFTGREVSPTVVAPPAAQELEAAQKSTVVIDSVEEAR
jgi:hypothetical protein